MSTAVILRAKLGPLGAALLLLVPVAAACHRPRGDADPAHASGAGDYWCTVGAPGTPGAGRCSAVEASCTSHVLAAGPDGGALHCQPTHTVLYRLQWNSLIYGR